MKSCFCPFCGIRTNNNSKENIISCCQCMAVVSIEVMSKPTKTFTEVQKEFRNTQLTELQATGRANKGKWARKRKTSG